MRVRRTALGGRFATHRSLVPRQRLQSIADAYLASGYINLMRPICGPR